MYINELLSLSVAILDRLTKQNHNPIAKSIVLILTKLGAKKVERLKLS